MPQCNVVISFTSPTLPFNRIKGHTMSMTQHNLYYCNCTNFNLAGVFFWSSKIVFVQKVVLVELIDGSHSFAHKLKLNNQWMIVYK